jgi:hypothetical protein
MQEQHTTVSHYLYPRISLDELRNDLWADDTPTAATSTTTTASNNAMPAPPPPPAPAVNQPQLQQQQVQRKRAVKFRGADTNVVSFSFASLASGVTIATGDPTYCGGCKAVFSYLSKITR